MSHAKYLRKRDAGINLEVSKTLVLQLFILGNVDGRLVAVQDSFLHNSVSSMSPPTRICFALWLLNSILI